MALRTVSLPHLPLQICVPMTQDLAHGPSQWALFLAATQCILRSSYINISDGCWVSCKIIQHVYKDIFIILLSDLPQHPLEHLLHLGKWLVLMILCTLGLVMAFEVINLLLIDRSILCWEKAALYFMRTTIHWKRLNTKWDRVFSSLFSKP